MHVRPELGPVRASWRKPITAQPTDALAEVDPPVPAHHGALVRVVGSGAMGVMWAVERVLDGIDLAAWAVEVVLSTAAVPFRWAWARWHARR